MREEAPAEVGQGGHTMPRRDLGLARAWGLCGPPNLLKQWFELVPLNDAFSFGLGWHPLWYRASFSYERFLSLTWQ